MSAIKHFMNKKDIQRKNCSVRAFLKNNYKASTSEVAKNILITQVNLLTGILLESILKKVRTESDCRIFKSNTLVTKSLDSKFYS